MVRKPGNAVLDQDAPDDPESTRYWTSTGGLATESTKERQVGSMAVNVQSTAAIGGSLLASEGTGRPLAVGSSMAAPGAEEGLTLLASLKDASATAGNMEHQYLRP